MGCTVCTYGWIGRGGEMMRPKFRFFGKFIDGTMRMLHVDSIDFKNGFIYYKYLHCTAEGDSHMYGDVIGFEDGILMQST